MNRLVPFIREYRNAIIDGWIDRVALLPSARELPPEALRDHLPGLLDRLADAIERRDETAQPLENLLEQHATIRFRAGYDLRQVVAEYRLLRESIIAVYAQRGDISDESRSQLEAFTVMHEALDRAISEAVDQYAIERDREREAFIAMLGHDLREPLNAILFTATSMLQRQDASNLPASKDASRIARSAVRMERMVRDLLDFARGRLGGGFAVVPVPIDARELLADTVQEIADAHPERNITCLAREAAGDFQVEWDNDRITQVVTNLVVNAIVHGRDPILVEPVDEGESVRICVHNAGEIPAEMLPRLFTAFRSDAGTIADSRVTATRSRVGLGLYIVQQVALAHGGSVRADSQNGTTTIEVRLPRRSVVDSPTSQASARDGDGG